MLILFEFQFWHESPLTVSLSSIFQIRIETDPADRTQLRMTVASGDPTLTFEYVFDVQAVCHKFINPHFLTTYISLPFPYTG
jgi:hypothetical protein